jgi:hypothetical protein
MANELYNGLRPYPNAKVLSTNDFTPPLLGKSRHPLVPLMGYGKSPMPSISYLDNAAYPNQSKRVLCCKQVPNLVLENNPRTFTQGFHMIPPIGIARKQPRGLAYVRPIDGPLMRYPNNQFALLDSMVGPND